MKKPKKKTKGMNNNLIFRFFMKLTGYLPGLLVFRPRYYHEDPTDKSRPLKGNGILIANHTAIVDFFMMFLAFPFKCVRCLVSEALYRHSFIGWLSRQAGNILVHRERSDLSFMNNAEKALKKNHLIGIFPEGHLVHDGKLDTFKPSVVYLALRTNAPIIPMYIDGHYGTAKRPRIVIGKKIYLHDYCSNPNPSIEEVKNLCEMLRQKVLDLKKLLNIYLKTGTQGSSKINWFSDFMNVVLKPLTPLIYPTKFHYADGASKKDRKIKGKAIIASKHLSFYDPPILSVHYFPKRVHTIVIDDVFNKNRWLFSHLLCLEYKRSGNGYDPSMMLKALSILKGNGALGIYPEGHITENEVGSFMDGTAYFALQSRAPIHIYCMLKPYKPFRRNHVMIGKTFYVDQLFNEDELKDRATILRLTNMLQSYISSLYEEGRKMYLKN